MDNKSNNLGEHELALFIACSKFDEMYPRDMQPEWLKYCMSMDVARNERNNWVIKMLLSPKKELEADQYQCWKDNGVPELIRVDPVTGEKSYIICNGPAPDPVVFFEVEVDIDKQAATVLTDMNPNKLDGAEYELCTCW